MKRLSIILTRYRIAKSYNLFSELLLKLYIAPCCLLQPNLTNHRNNKFILVIVDR